MRMLKYLKAYTKYIYFQWPAVEFKLNHPIHFDIVARQRHKFMCRAVCDFNKAIGMPWSGMGIWRI